MLVREMCEWKLTVLFVCTLQIVSHPTYHHFIINMVKHGVHSASHTYLFTFPASYNHTKFTQAIDLL